MSHILEGQEGVANTIDHIVVFRRTGVEGDLRREQVLQRFKSVGVKVNRSKYVPFVHEVKLIGVMSSDSGLRFGPEKSKEANLEVFTNVRCVRRLLGMGSHLGRFLPYW